MAVHVVQPGECLATIALKYGFRERALYDHPSNAKLKKKRRNPNILAPGDEVVIPDKLPRYVTAATEKKHKFVHERPMKKLHVVLKDEDGDPIAAEPYVLRYGGVTIEDQTTGEGAVEAEVPLSLTSATLDCGGRRYALSLGGLNPMEEMDDGGTSGARHRLANLGLTKGSHDGGAGSDLSSSLALFQLTRGLPVTGQLDEATRKQLETDHGS